MNDRLKEVAERAEKHWIKAAHETLKMIDERRYNQYVAVAGASWLTRMKVKWLNFKSRFKQV